MRVKKPVILQILPSLESGGVEQGTLDMANAIIDHGWNSYVYSSGGIMVKPIVEKGSHHITVPLDTKNPVNIVRNAFTLAKLMRRHKVTLIHARSRAPAWSALLASKLTKTPLITTVHGAYRNSNPFKRLYNSVMLRGHKVIAVSNFIRTYIAQDFPRLNPCVDTIYRGIDESFLSTKPSDEDIEILKKEWNLTRNTAPIILLPGRLNKDKGHKIAAKALKKIKKAKLVCVGKDKKNSNVKKNTIAFARGLGISNRVIFPGLCHDMQTAYALADIVILPAVKPESFGRVAVEAMAMGKMVIASDVGGTAETIKDGETGFLFRSGDAKDLAEKIEHVLSLSDEEKEKIKRAARKHVKTHYLKTQMTEKTISLYESLLV